MPLSFLRILFICIAILHIALFVRPVRAAEAAKLGTNQKFLEEISRQAEIDFTKPLEVFSFVFDALPSDVTVYPTENYYYYSFYDGGTNYVGNIRLDALDRDKGILHFAYFNASTPWNEELVSEYRQFKEKDGIKVKKLDNLTYQVTFKEKSVVFHLNDLSKVVPPPGIMQEYDTYIGPVYDESGIQFFLLYNSQAKIFHFILNQNKPVPEFYSPARKVPDVIIGSRSGFAFIKDRFLDRQILIGVYAGNSMVNNYYDGPFDQLPDNFLKGNILRDALIDETPKYKGTIDRFGNIGDGTTRALVAPYLHYNDADELTVLTKCTAAAGLDKVEYYECFKVLTATRPSPQDGTSTPSH
jgi:hypothetical protein